MGGSGSASREVAGRCTAASPASAVHPRGLLREGIHPAVVNAPAGTLGTLNGFETDYSMMGSKLIGLPLKEVHPAVFQRSCRYCGMAKWL